MRDRIEPLLKLTCLVLAVLIVSRIAAEMRPAASLGEVAVPSLEDLNRPPAEEEQEMGRSSSSRSSSSRTMRSSSRPKLPPEVTARVDQVYKSEVFGPIPRPLPMAVMGLIGEDVILRTPTGQEKLMKVGDEAGGVKILEIGINRVLVEQDGQKKELTLHRGYGSESLLSKEKKP